MTIVRKTKEHCVESQFSAYMHSEIKVLIADVSPCCPVASPKFNKAAMGWIEKNAARFRKQWERYHNGKKVRVVGN